MQDDLNALREEINNIDAQVVELVNARAKVSIKIGEVKKVLGKDIYDPDREREVLDRINAQSKGPISKGALEDIFVAIMSSSREIQNSRR